MTTHSDPPFDTAPSNVGQGMALGSALVATVTLLPVTLAAGLAGLGTVLVAVALRRESQGLLEAATATIVAALLVGGVYGLPAELLVVATAATVLVWDVADNALTVGAQLGRCARTERLELVHAAATLSVAVVGSAFVYGVYELAGGGRPLLAVVLMLLGSTLIVAVLR